jgi:hypothetical protein
MSDASSEIICAFGRVPSCTNFATGSVAQNFRAKRVATSSTSPSKSTDVEPRVDRGVLKWVRRRIVHAPTRERQERPERRAKACPERAREDPPLGTSWSKISSCWSSSCCYTTDAGMAPSEAAAISEAQPGSLARTRALASVPSSSVIVGRAAYGERPAKSVLLR